MKRRKSQLLVGLGSAIMMAGAGAPGAAPALLAVRQPHGSNVEKRAKAIGVARSAAPDAAQTCDRALREQPARLACVAKPATGIERAAAPRKLDPGLVRSLLTVTGDQPGRERIGV